MKITPSLFHAYIKCPTKCWLKSTGEPATGNPYAEWVQSQNESYHDAAIERLRSKEPQEECAVAPAQEDLKTSKWRLGFDVVATSQNLQTCLHAVERVPSEGRGKAARFIPIRFVFTNKLGKDEKLLLAFDAFVLSEILGREVGLGKIIHGNDHSTLKVKTSALAGEVRKRLDKIATLLSNATPPDLVLNQHCVECEFQARCRQKAIEKDDLSLLATMSVQERQKLRAEGIFTATQLSYTFRPRRRPKHLRDKREKYHHSLKALAIREKKIYVVGSPQLKVEGTPVYLDVESLPDVDLYYLIGLRINTGSGLEQHSFWANDADDCAGIWKDFLDLLAGLKNPCLLHYGSFEKTFLKQMCSRFGGPPPDATQVVHAIECSVNLVSSIYAQIYFPTFSNGLKDIAGFLGFKWSEPDAAGTTSVMWRQSWDLTRNHCLKDKLIRYNAEDCEALTVVERAIIRLGNHHEQAEKAENQGLEVIRTDELRHPLTTKWNDFKSPLQDLELITNAAHWDYQRERVYFRSQKARRNRLRKAEAGNRTKRSSHPDNVIKAEEAVDCPICHTKAVRHGMVRPRNQHEIIFGRSSVKRRFIRYEYQRYRCPKCKLMFAVNGDLHKKGKPTKYGRSLVAFLFYQIIELYIPARVVLIMLKRLFGLGLDSMMATLFKAQLAEYYTQTYQQILNRVIVGDMVNADETFVSIKGKRAYAWVLTNGKEVAYLYSETREGELAQKLLGDFKGVLVSDFYAVYDSFDCPQQKCLIHLVRDLNSALLDNPYDEEVKCLIKSFGEMLKTIIEEIDRRGLKRRFLRKHMKLVKKFYRKFVHKNHQSPAAISCAERFEKNRDKLFTFLDYDAVPWNNNNAEHAMKAVARLRDVIEGSATEKSMREYLILLSICQTCKYQGLDFLDFLRSGEKDIHAFAESRACGRRKRPSQGSQGEQLGTGAIS